VRQEGAQVGGPEIGDIGDRRRAAQMAGQESEELARVALIGLERERGQAPFGAERAQPVLAGGDQVGTGIDEEFFHAGHPSRSTLAEGEGRGIVRWGGAL
jgi:hypothetical protein